LCNLFNTNTKLVKIKIMLVDDHVMFCEGLQILIDRDENLECTGFATNGLDAVKLAHANPPNVVIMDFDMPKYNGIVGITELQREFPHLPILILSMFKDKEHIFDVIKAGAKGYVCKDSSIEDIITAVKAIHGGHAWFKGEIANVITPELITLLKGETKPSVKEILTRREDEIIFLFAEGYTKSQVGEKLGISPHTVQAHTAHILKKLKLKSTVELLHYAIRKNIKKVNWNTQN
jgi:DNA-binding NarL/FixJ family response regulator